ncbi:NADP-dependent oxidoreductase domain-containing protein [Dipodascopsis tothii]|uniref:NADP-dependent oxidoreductase domain-containing protein n=1 Tax=Dipodascopsis tothii TaxID=44089 RepID=UPI0034CF50BA
MVGTGRTLLLNTGARLPAIGLGTYEARDVASIKKGIELGYRQIDTAMYYLNEAEVGQAVRECGVPREELFVTTKLWCTFHSRVRESFESSMEKLGLEYIDLFMMHWPTALNPNGNHPYEPTLPDGSSDIQKDWDFIKTWADMQKLLDTGRVRAIGVSNFSTVNLDKLLAAPTTTVVPAVNQVELHPYLPQFKLLNYCKEKGIVLTGYSPLGSVSAPLLQEKVVIEMAERLGKTPAQVILSWAVTRGTSVIPKSVNPQRQLSNLDDFVMAPEDMALIDDISKTTQKRIVTSSWGQGTFHDDEF